MVKQQYCRPSLAKVWENPHWINPAVYIVIRNVSELVYRFLLLHILGLKKKLLILKWVGGWSGGAKVSCTSGHRGVQLILAYSWARPAILVAGKGRRGMFLFLLFLHFHSCSSFFPVLSFIYSTISSISFLPVSGRRHKMTHKGWCVVKPQHNQFKVSSTWRFP